MDRAAFASLLRHPLRDALLLLDAGGAPSERNAAAAALVDSDRWARLVPLLDAARAVLDAGDEDEHTLPASAWPGRTLTLRVLRDGDGTRAGYSLSAVRRKRRSRKALRASERERLLERVQQIGSMGIWIWQSAKSHIWLSDGAARIGGLGEVQATVALSELSRFIEDAQARHRLRQDVTAALAGGTPYQQEFDLRRPDGELRRVIVRGEAIQRADGGAERLFGLVQDVTEQRKSEETTRRRTELLSRIARVGRIGGWEFNLVTGQLDWTDENYIIHGIPIGTPVSVASTKHMYEGRSREVFEAALARISVGERDEESIEVQFVTPDEERIWLRISGQLERRDGKPYRITGHTRDITAEREASERIEQLAHYDALTGLPNRTQFRELAARAIQVARRQGQTVALLFVDLDRFKLVNDSLGHEAGDQLLLDVAGRIRATVRTGDVVARQSGDEFLVLLREVKRPEDAGRVAHKIIQAVGRPVTLPAGEAGVGCSIGIAVLSEENASFEAMLRAADTAMYAAKEAGRNNYQFYSDAYYARIQRRVTLESELRQALAREEFEVLYQPTIDLHNGRVRCLEALLRWQRPDGERRTPAEFIPIAEDCGEIIPIGRWVLDQACRQARAWDEAGLPFERIAVNVSAIQLRDPEFAGQVLASCEAAGWPPQRLELELTESALMRDSDALRRAFALFEAHGIGLSVDDFGTGFSNLHYLHRFPVHHLKIDRSFVGELLEDRQLARLSEAIVGLGHALRLRVIAEGVEDEATAIRLRRLGCDEAQGYLYTAPLAADAMAEWIRARAEIAVAR